MKKILTVVFLLGCVVSSLAQVVQSPDQFLRYKLGDRYTPHYRIVEYFKYVSQAVPNRMKLEQYGETYEGRPLYLAFFSSPENMARLESIRMNNLRLANATKDRAAPTEDGIVIVWLSYNVHGNEPSSSEAAMKTLHALADPSNTRTKEWLKNTVVIIDPCLNPDGRDRYVNWFTSVVGNKPNADPQSREHSEPWPGGRTNHYNFDLNRDWAWQSQVETQQRIKKYNEWLPQVHVDFHEQGFNEPYYFAPAAEPFHEVITPWQREFQTMIGRNNAKYFDQAGWLYFTKERFDLFYPSYGDTYPTYNGAIGMTYEQGGHSRGGLAVVTEDEDTLTLADRLEHHFTTSLATIEVTSQNAARVQKEFRKYFNDAVNAPGGEFKAVIIKSDKGDRLTRLVQLLDRNGIDWANLNDGTFNGINYNTGRSESFRAGASDIVINMNQSKSNLIRVLFERNSKLSDSATYDITAWALPYAYGLQAYAVNNFVASSGKHASPTMAMAIQPAYAYVASWDGLQSAKFLSNLLQQKIKVRYAEQAFVFKGRNFEKGSLIITRAANAQVANLAQAVTDAAMNTGIDVYALESGFVDKGFDVGSDRVRIIKAPKVAMVTGSGIGSNAAGEIWHFFEQQLGYPLTLINHDELPRASWKDIDVLIMPDGFYRFLNDKASADQLKTWVQQGGRIVALENAVAQLSRAEWGLKLKGEEKKDDKKEEKKDDYSLLRRYENRERDFLVTSIPGSVYRVQLDNSHPLAFGYGDTYYTLKQDDNIYEFIKEGGWNVGVLKKDNHVSGFAGSKTKERLKDGLLFGVQDLGRGNVVYLADAVLFRSFWENGKLLLCNAVFLVGQ
ncbi:MAG TPA: M14 metallopeptidase family protein [Chitinophagaceae bacterium]|nr:M14 metallopeptidase family protein [Chitinophagaceae bacterium]